MNCLKPSNMQGLLCLCSYALTAMELACPMPGWPYLHAFATDFEGSRKRLPGLLTSIWEFERESSGFSVLIFGTAKLVSISIYSFGKVYLRTETDFYLRY